MAALTGNEHFAWDAYRRFTQMFAEIVLGVPAERLADVGAAAARRHAVATESELGVEALQALVEHLQAVILGHARQEVPTDPEEQLRLAIAAVFDSWMNRRAIDYRRMADISADIGTAVTIQSMVFGNTGDESGTGVVFTRNPTTGESELYGELLRNAQGEGVVARIRTPLPIARMAEELPDAHRQLREIAERLETHYRDMQDLEFTVEHGKLWMLQTRSGKRTGRAAIRIAVDQANEGVLSKQEAVRRVTPAQLEQVLHPLIDPNDETPVLATGLPASPGAASGRVAFTADAAVRLAEEGEPAILVRQETSPDDFHGMVAAEATVTSRGGVTSHAAVVARGMGKCCVVGCEASGVARSARNSNDAASDSSALPYSTTPSSRVSHVRFPCGHSPRTVAGDDHGCAQDRASAAADLGATSPSRLAEAGVWRLDDTGGCRVARARLSNLGLPSHA